jgi:predicted ATPase/class 3 adenylate cyclase/tRNA A-37 threonylcarbamoyl transferase component Bud32
MTDSFEEYENVQILSKRNNRNFFRVTRIADKSTFILKSIQGDYPKSKDLAKINHEFLILKKLQDNKGIIKVVELKEMANNMSLLMEDTPFDTLADYLETENISIVKFLEIAIRFCEILGKLHNKEIIHRNVKPDNILYNPNTNEVKLVDFELASELSHDYQPQKVINSLEGALEYISPEQTGRMNRPVTASTDLYSTGIVFYQMITGHLPFQEVDPASLVYAHIAIEAKAPYLLNQEIPEMLSKVIMKLLNKKAEDRYKTAFGLQSDLKKCLEFYKENQSIPIFKLAENDFSNKFEIPDKLYGREDEVSYVLSVFDEMCKEQTNKLLLVYGYSGIGKTSLVNEVQKPIVQKKGIFIDGKIDQYHRDQPYFSLTQAFNKLIEMWFSETDVVLDKWREEITKELGEVVQVIIDLVPLLGKLIKNPPKLIELNALESKKRLQLTLLKFIKIITKNETPIVLFIDDAQWSSSTLLDLLKYLITTEELKNLMVIIGYRDNEVLAGHPVLQFIDEVEEVMNIKKINLKPLNKETVNEIVRDTLGYIKKNAEELTEIFYSKTEGNPFFLKEVLQELYTKKFILFSQTTGKWEYDSKTILELVNLSSNVVDFMVKKIQGFSERIQKVMNTAACIGNIFSHEDVADVLDMDRNEIAKDLWRIVKEGMILPVSGDYEHSHERVRNEKQKTNIIYRFQHDRIQQASYQLANDAENMKTHYRIGNSLYIKFAGRTEKYSLEIASQLNKALGLVIGEDERNKLMYLNYYAGENMLASSAYFASVEYFSVAKSLLPIDHWNSLYDFTFKLYISLSKALFSSTDFEKAESLMDALINNAKTFLERMSIINLKAVLYSTIGKRNISIPLAIKGLNEMGVSISEHPSKYSILLAQWQIKWYLGNRKISSLLNDPEVTDPAKVLIAEFLYLVTQDSMFIGNPPLLVLSNMKLVNLSIKYGNFRSTTIAYAMYAGAVLGPTEDSRQFAELAVGVLEKLNAIEHKCKTYHWYAMFCLTFHSWWGRKREFYMKSIKYGLETGDIRYLAYAIDHTTPFDPTFTIKEAIDFDKGYEITLKETGYREIMCLRNTYNHYLLSLCGKTKDRLSMSDDHFDEIENEKEMSELYFFLGPTLYHLMKSLLCFLYDEFELSLKEINKIQENVINAYYGCPDFMMYVVNKFLTYAALYDTLSAKEKTRALEIMNAEFSRMKMLAQHCPDNYLFHYLAMQAEIARIENKPWPTILVLYEQAIQAAEKYKFLNFVGIYSERAAKLLLGNQIQDMAQSYLKKARYAYERWGASEKVKHLDEKYSKLIYPQGMEEQNGSNSKVAINDFSETGSLDYSTILKLSKTLFEEKNIRKLIEKTLKILAENIGAQHCVLILLNNGKLAVEGILDAHSNKLEVLHSLEFDEKYVPVNLINYVLHSGHDVVIEDISKDLQYSHLPYILSNPIKSIICVPIISHQDIIGIFYGEHREIAGAFTIQRLEMLRVLSGIIATALENTRYVEHMERLYRATDRFVPKHVLKMLNKEHVEDVKLGDSMETEMTVMFTDVRGYTSLTEEMNPVQAYEFINAYLKEVAPIIRKYQGFISQYQGDGIMALFPGTAEDGLNAVLDMNEALLNFNAVQSKLNRPSIQVGYGLNTGPVMLGTIGEEERMDVNVISDAINLASRVESLNKYYETNFLITDSTLKKLNDSAKYLIRIVDKVQVKGKRKVIILYEVFMREIKTKEQKAFISTYDSAFNEYAKGNITKALAMFNECLVIKPQDRSSMILIERCENYQLKGLPSGWDGTHTMTQK